MESSSFINSDELIKLIGLCSNDVHVQESLSLLARGMQPELDPEDEETLVDWVTVNELGLEYGFEDEAYVRALDPDKRLKGPLLLSQLYFYGDTPTTKPFPYPLPFGLSFDDKAASVRRKLAEYETSRRSYIRDAWRLPKFNLTIAYRGEGGPLESVFCYLPYKAWPSLPGEAELLAPFTPEVFTSLFGLRWSNAVLRTKLEPLGFDEERIIGSPHRACGRSQNEPRA